MSSGKRSASLASAGRAQAARRFGVDRLRIVPAGVEWDAVRIPRRLWLAALDRLPVPHGPVITDPDDRVVYVLVPRGTARGWDAALTQAYGVATYVAVPPEGRDGPPGPYWLVAPVDWVPLTDPGHLRLAIEAVTGPDGAIA